MITCTEEMLYGKLHFCAVCFRYTCKRLNMIIKLLNEVKNIAASQKSLNSYVLMCEVTVYTYILEYMNFK